MDSAYTASQIGPMAYGIGRSRLIGRPLFSHPRSPQWWQHPRKLESIASIDGSGTNDQKTELDSISKKLDSLTACMLQYLPGQQPPSDLENCTDSAQATPEGKGDPMAYQRVRVLIGNDSYGKPVYRQVGGNNQNEINDAIVAEYIHSGRIYEMMSQPCSPLIAQQSDKHNFAEYAENWYRVFSKPNIEQATAITYRRQLDRYWLPYLGGKDIEDISASDIQAVFNGMGDVSKSTKQKAHLVLNMILSQAVEDGIISRNVSKSRVVKVAGKAAKDTEPYSVEQMQYLAAHIPNVKLPADKAFLALAALHPLRLEEVLGLQYKDIDREADKIHILRAVTHPDRNQPVIKDTKTESSIRVIDMVSQVKQFIPDGNPDDYIVGGKKPMSYQQVRRMRNRIKKDTGFDEDIVPRRFRTTVLSDLYHECKDLKQTQAAAGHSNSNTTLRYYIKDRRQNYNTASPVANLYGLADPG